MKLDKQARLRPNPEVTVRSPHTLRTRAAASALLGLVLALPTASAAPPFSGTIFIEPDIITAADPTTLLSVSYAGRGTRTMFDRRVAAFVEFNAYLFQATYSGGLQIEFEVNPEFGSVEAAQSQVALYAPVIGRLPRALRLHVQTSWIHQGDQPFGGGNDNLLIHTGSVAQSYIAAGILEEALAHEAAHTSLDGDIATAPAWLAAQAADPEFISTYARDNATREDVAESFVPYLALKIAGDRISAETAQSIRAAMPNRIAYFDTLHLDLAPLPSAPLVLAGKLSGSYFDPTRAGEGVLLEIGRSGTRKVLFLSWYTYFLGQQRWIVGNIDFPAGATRVTVPLIVTSGTGFGPEFDPGQIQITNWGSATVEFPSCTTLSFSWTNTTGQSATYNYRRLVDGLDGVTCP